MDTGISVGGIYGTIEEMSAEKVRDIPGIYAGETLPVRQVAKGRFLKNFKSHQSHLVVCRFNFGSAS